MSYIFNLEVLKAGYGDAFIITYGKEDGKITNVIIDGGIGDTIKDDLKNRVETLTSNGGVIDLLIITHIDDDHLVGIKHLFENSVFNKENLKEIWFNSGKQLKFNKESFVKIELKDDDGDDDSGPRDYGVKKAYSLEKLIEDLEIEWKSDAIKVGHTFSSNGGRISVISPNDNALNNLNEKWIKEAPKPRDYRHQVDYNRDVQELVDEEFDEDESIANSSSIAVIIEYKKKKILMLGDSIPSILIEYLSQINNKKYDITKISHHGSRRNTSEELLDLIDCHYFIISTNGKRFKHPDKECLARIVDHYKEEVILAYNYNIGTQIFTPSEIRKYKIKEIVINEPINLLK